MKWLNEKSFPVLSSADIRGSGSSDLVSHLMWSSERIPQKILHTPIFDISSVYRKSPDGQEGDFVRLEAPEWVTVVPYFTDSKGIMNFVMELQYRHGSSSVSLEFPAGMVEEGENPQDAAKRELLEETGLAARNLVLIGKVNPNSAFMTNTAYFYAASDFEDTGTRNLDQNEQIDVCLTESDTILENVGTGLLSNGINVIAAHFFTKFLNC